MRTERLERAIQEAERFLDMAKQLQIKDCSYGKLAATVKRRSMDLSNALSDLRKSNYVEIPKH